MKSYSTFDNEIREFILRNFPALDTPILDIGAGSGKFRKLLFDYVTVDAVEIHEPYVNDHELMRTYNYVYIEDVMEVLDILKNYPVIILGDVLEHLSIVDARRLLSTYKGTVICAIPYEYEQGPVNDNIHERHLQEDLTHKIFMDRYAGFKSLIKNEQYGIYVKGPGIKSASKMPEEKPAVFDQSKFEDVRILIATPVADQCTVAYTQSLAKTMRALTERGIPCGLAMIQGHSIQQSRNRLVASFMADGEFTHLLFIDSDHGWEVKNILRLLHLDRDVIGIIARKKTPDIQWAANIEDMVHIDNGAMNVREIGTGFVMIKRKVFVEMFEQYPDLKLQHPDPEKVGTSEDENYYILFQWEIQDGVERSEDLVFCKRWRGIGGEVWADPGAAISHIGSYDYYGSVSTLFREKVEAA